jgi:hypothetical protein
MRRRSVLKGLAGLAAVAGLSRLGVARAQQEADRTYSAIGFSQGGVPLIIHHVGTGTRRLFVMGGQHGWPERNTVELAQYLLDYFKGNPGDLPTGVGLDVMVVANPDGYEVGSRQYLSGVDPNRNWGSHDWQSDTWDSNGAYRTGIGGPRPFSEPETRALRDWVVDSRPIMIVHYHSQGGFMFGPGDGDGADLAKAYADASAHYRSGGGGTRAGASLLGYRATGSMGVWQRDKGYPGIFIELSTSDDPEIERNMAGLRAMLRLLAGQA